MSTAVLREDEITINISWQDQTPQGSQLALDSTAIIFDGAGNALEAVYFNKPQNTQNSIRHSRSYEKDLEHTESIVLCPPTLPKNARAIAIVLNNFVGETFSVVGECAVTIDDGKELTRFTHPCCGMHSAVFIGVALLQPGYGNWSFHTRWHFMQGSAFDVLIPEILVKLKQDLPSIKDDAVIYFLKSQELTKDDVHKLDERLWLSSINVSLAWSMKNDIDLIDLDASCVLFDGRGRYIEGVFYGKLKNRNSSISHNGDNITTHSDDSNEVIHVNLRCVPEEVRTLVFCLNCYGLIPFKDVVSTIIRVSDSSDGQEQTRFELESAGKHTAMIMAALSRSGDGWSFLPVGTPAKGRTFQDIMPKIKSTVKSVLKREKPPWDADDSSENCILCLKKFTILERRHHCRACGKICCQECSQQKRPVLKWGYDAPVRVCDKCYSMNEALKYGQEDDRRKFV